ncbi:hypothetical protein ACHAW6_002789 [Cyclotella cf. meneghiniana]
MAEQNLFSIPRVFHSTLAPEGYHIIHVYMSASEDFVDWEAKLVDNIEANDYKQDKWYKDLKEKKVDAL